MAALKNKLYYSFASVLITFLRQIYVKKQHTDTQHQFVKTGWISVVLLHAAVYSFGSPDSALFHNKNSSDWKSRAAEGPSPGAAELHTNRRANPTPPIQDYPLGALECRKHAGKSRNHLTANIPSKGWGGQIHRRRHAARWLQSTSSLSGRANWFRLTGSEQTPGVQRDRKVPLVTEFKTKIIWW